jgi:hypothetical protein
MRVLARAIIPESGCDGLGCEDGCASPSTDCTAKADPAKGRCDGADVKRSFLTAPNRKATFVRLPAGSPDDQKQGHHKHEDSKNKKSEETHAKNAEQG